jgi:ankyrin repeat protein
LTATRASQNIEIMRLLLKSGANPNAPSTLSVEESHRVNIFPMHFAAISENIELVKLLLDYGAGLNLKNKAGHGPLFYVCQRGDVGMMRFLLKYGANPALSSPEGISPLDLILKNRMLLKAYEDHRPEGGYFLG